MRLVPLSSTCASPLQRTCACARSPRRCARLHGQSGLCRGGNARAKSTPEGARAISSCPLPASCPSYGSCRSRRRSTAKQLLGRWRALTSTIIGAASATRTTALTVSRSSQVTEMSFIDEKTSKRSRRFQRVRSTTMGMEHPLPLMPGITRREAMEDKLRSDSARPPLWHVAQNALRILRGQASRVFDDA